MKSTLVEQKTLNSESEHLHAIKIIGNEESIEKTPKICEISNEIIKKCNNDKEFYNEIIETMIKRILNEDNEGLQKHFTKSVLCNEMIEYLQIGLNDNILCVANLEFIVHLIEKGIDPKYIFFLTFNKNKAEFASDILGLLSDNIICCSSFDLKKNFKNILKEKLGNMKMKFKVIGNPPWNEGEVGKNTDIYDEFFYCFMPYADIIVFITNGTFLSSPKKKFATLREEIGKYGIIKMIQKDAKKEFDVTIDAPAIISILKRGAGNEFDLQTLSRNILRVQLTKSSVPVKMLDEPIREQIYKKVSTVWIDTINTERGRTTQLSKEEYKQSVNGIGNVSLEQNSVFRYKTLNRLSGELTKKPEWVWCDTEVDDCCSQYRLAYGITSTNLGIGPILLLEPGIQLTQTSCYIPLEKEEHYRGYSSWLKSKVFSIILNTFRVNTTNSLGIIRLLPCPSNDKDLTTEWTNEDLYRFFNFTKEEIDFIEQKSSRKVKKNGKEKN